jgi:nitrite reductase/ring-hydroxylating ferredoxin subunit
MPLCLARLNGGEILGVDDNCSHEGGSLSEGFLVGEEVECPMHGSLFDLRTGAVQGCRPPSPFPFSPSASRVTTSSSRFRKEELRA